MTAELELLAASRPFLTAGQVATRHRRERLRAAVLAVVRRHDAASAPELITHPAEALAALDALLSRCEAIGVPWTEIVARVNRGARGHE